MAEWRVCTRCGLAIQPMLWARPIGDGWRHEHAIDCVGALLMQYGHRSGVIDAVQVKKTGAREAAIVYELRAELAAMEVPHE